MDSSIGDNILRALAIARRRWLLLVIPCMLMVPLSVIAATYYPGGYKARALILMQETAASSPLARDGGTLSREYLADTYVVIRALLQSDSVLGNALELEGNEDAKHDPVKRAQLIKSLAARVTVELVGNGLLRFELAGGNKAGLGAELRRVLASLFDILIVPPQESAKELLVKTIEERQNQIDLHLSTGQVSLAQLLPQGLPAGERALESLVARRAAVEKSLAISVYGPENSQLEQTLVELKREIEALQAAIGTYKASAARLAQLPGERQMFEARLKTVQSRIASGVDGRGVLRAPHLMIIVDAPRDPEIRTRSRSSWGILGIVGGLLLGALLVAISEIFDATEYAEHEIKVVERMLRRRKTASASIARIPSSGGALRNDGGRPPGAAGPDGDNDQMVQAGTKAGRRASEAMLLAAIAFCLCAGSSAMAEAIGSAIELPKTQLEIAMPKVGGRSIELAAGGDLQAAIDTARGGDEVVLAAGAVFKGTFRLRRRSDQGWVVIRSAGPLPKEGVRADSSHVAGMATLKSLGTGQPVLRTDPGAQRYYLIGLHITADANLANMTTLVDLGAPAGGTVEDIPSEIVITRSYIHGHGGLQLRRAVTLNSASTVISDSTLDEVHHKSSDAQAICGWAGPGPYLIQNNRLEASGENVMFGGADPVHPDMVPSDITIRGNKITKPDSWRKKWLVKNLLELKLGRRVLIENNTLSNNWVDGQSGFAVNLKTTHQEGTAPWSRTSHVTFRGNIVKNSPSAIKISAGPQAETGQPASHFAILDNTFIDIGETAGASAGILFQLLGYEHSLAHVTIAGNVAVRGVGKLGHVLSFDGKPTTNLKFTGNIVFNGAYGIKGSGTPPGLPTLARYAPEAVVKSNIFVGGTTRGFGPLADSNQFPAAATFVMPPRK